MNSRNDFTYWEDIIGWSDPLDLKKTVYRDGTIGPSFYERELNYLQYNSDKFNFNYQQSINQGIFSK
mgnify:CR=1 FL=1